MLRIIYTFRQKSLVYLCWSNHGITFFTNFRNGKMCKRVTVQDAFLFLSSETRVISCCCTSRHENVCKTNCGSATEHNFLPTHKKNKKNKKKNLHVHRTTAPSFGGSWWRPKTCWTGPPWPYTHTHKSLCVNERWTEIYTHSKKVPQAFRHFFPQRKSLPRKLVKQQSRFSRSD